MTWFLGGLALLVLLATLLHGFATASVAQVKRGGAILLAVAGALAFALMLYSGRAPQAIAALTPMAPLAIQLWRGWRQARRFRAPASGPATEVETTTLSMRLDLGNGQISGRVRRGPWAGRELGEMTRADVIQLLAECETEDPESVPLLENWLDRAEPGWREEAAAAAGPGMDRKTALALLGLSEGATPAEIRDAHRRLMRDAHPDRGGSAEKAAALNRARDFLLR